MPFPYPAVFLLRQIPQHLAQIFTQTSVYGLLAILGYPDNVVLERRIKMAMAFCEML